MEPPPRQTMSPYHQQLYNAFVDPVNDLIQKPFSQKVDFCCACYCFHCCMIPGSLLTIPITLVYMLCYCCYAIPTQTCNDQHFRQGISTLWKPVRCLAFDMNMFCTHCISGLLKGKPENMNTYEKQAVYLFEKFGKCKDLQIPLPTKLQTIPE